MKSEKTQTVWEIVEAAPAYAGNVAYLWSWSLNYDYDHPSRPFPLFLDLIGYSQDRYGSKSSVWGVTDCDGVGYLEASLLGKALADWADCPHEVEAWLDLLLSAPEYEGDEE